MEDSSDLDLEIELISSVLLPVEHLTVSSETLSTRIIDIRSDQSKLAIQVSISQSYPADSSVHVVIKGDEIGRDEAEDWRGWANERLKVWDATEEYPLYQLLTIHFIPLLAPPSPPSSPSSAQKTPSAETSVPHHVLLTSHHLIAPSKRKDLVSLSSQLSLVGFAKTGHPGIMYAMGDRADLMEWLREVKSWRWLALRVRVAPETVPDFHTGEIDDGNQKGKEQGARGGKKRGEWTEVERVGEAVEWMKLRGRERLLADTGIGAGSVG